MDRVRVESAIEAVQRRVAPDIRVASFDVDATISGDVVTLSGVVQSPQMRVRTVSAVRATIIGAVEADTLIVLEEHAEPLTTDVEMSVVPVRSEPAADAERVTSLVYGMAVMGFDRTDGWRRVRAPDGYLGWVRDTQLQPSNPIETDAVLTADVDLESSPGQLYAGTPCKVVDRGRDAVGVSFRTGREVSVSSDVVGRPFERAVEPDRVVSNALRYLGTGYHWGGMTSAGIDCSGLVWIAYWQEGIRLPRDADQQRAVGTEIERTEVEPGDLLFFPGHVAMSLGGDEYVHASGSADEVAINSFDPEAGEYEPDRDEDFEQARRILYRGARDVQ